jgi:hypothetical protein
MDFVDKFAYDAIQNAVCLKQKYQSNFKCMQNNNHNMILCVHPSAISIADMEDNKCKRRGVRNLRGFKVPQVAYAARTNRSHL